MITEVEQASGHKVLMKQNQLHTLLSLIFVLPPALDNFGAVKERVINLKTIST